jgi:hypothetical protein
MRCRRSESDFRFAIAPVEIDETSWNKSLYGEKPEQ